MNTIAYCNGELVKADELTVPPYDAGFLLGTTIAEQIRTFNGRPFWLDQHLARFARGLDLAEINLPVDRRELLKAVYTVVAHNYPIQSQTNGATSGDLGVTIFATPGAYASYGVPSAGPMFAVHTYPLQFQLWAGHYEVGRDAVFSDHIDIPTRCWPAELKCRSRMHYYLASQKARRSNPQSVPILLDEDGYVAETPIASVVMFAKDIGFVAPDANKVLPGVSLAYLKQTTARIGIPFQHRDMRPEELLAADELFLTSTPFSVLPIVSIDQAPIGSGTPGQTYTKILNAWSDDVGVSIQEQALAFC